MGRNIVISLSHGFHVRNVVYSKLYEYLVDNYNVILIFPTGVKIPEKDLSILKGADIKFFDIKLHHFEKIFLFLRKNVFAGKERTQTYNLISEREKLKRPWLYRVASVFNSFFGRFPLVALWWQKFESLFIQGKEFDSFIKEINPSCVVAANYGTESLEVRLFRSCDRSCIPTVAIVPSWDNLSSKGIIGQNPKHLVVWNSIMKNEAKSLYGFEDKSVHICGGLQFDHYASPLSHSDCLSDAQRLGIDLEKPFVVFGTITPRYFPCNLDIIKILNEAIENNQLPSDLQIVVRLHPQVVDDNQFGDNLEQYREISKRFNRIKLSTPRVLKWGAITPPELSDTRELKFLLQLASVFIMPGSTLAIDASAFDCPVVGVGFDGYTQKPYSKSVRRMYDFTHYKRVVSHNGIFLAESEEDLISGVNKYLADRTINSIGRKKIVESHLEGVDGLSWLRIKDVIDNV